MELLERETALAEVQAALADAAAGEGRVVLVAGEAGVGKTSLVEALGERVGDRTRLLLGACDPLLTPRALGPVRDIARGAGGDLAAALDSGAPRETVVAAALDELDAGPPPRVMVIEDAHWADEATLDLLTVLGRRVGGTTGTLLVTFRSDEAGPGLRAAMGQLPPALVCRVDLAPLSRGAVDELAGRVGRAGDEIHRATGGNPFFVTEVLAGARDEVAPRTVRDAVLARAARLEPSAREVIELVSVVPGRAELWLVQAAIAPSRDDLEACLAAGMLESDGEVVRFRHEIARSSVEAELSPLRRRELERSVLAALLDREGVDLARVVHHARRAGDRAVVLAHAPAAARAASAAGAHVQAAEHYRATLAVADEVEPEARAALLEGLSFEAYLAGPPEEALASRQDALAIRSRLGQATRVGEDERWLSRILWWLGRGAEAEAASRRAIAVLEPLGPSAELAMAYSGMSQLMMLSWRIRDSIEWGDRAIELARRLDDGESLAHALTNVGTALSESGDMRGDDLLEEAVELALAEGYHDHAARAMVNLGWGRLGRRRYVAARETIETGLAFAGRHDLSFYTQYLLGMRAQWCLEQGDWAGAEVDARAVVAIHEAQPSISGHPGLLVLGRLLARRGEEEAGELLDQTWAMATEADEPQRIVPAGCAAAELAWLAGDLEGVEQMARRALDSASHTRQPQLTGEAAFWLWRAGALAEPPEGIEEPHRLSIVGDWRGAARGWERVECPYHLAEALSHADEEHALLRALEIYDGLGASRPAGRLRAELRRRGATSVPRGPRRETRESPLGLTPRQHEVLEMLCAGATNGQIAERLVLSTRTVDHHVAAVLGKLGVTSRRDVAAAARRLGVELAEDGQPAG
jgi:DNA-binding CsgD family transcriptional regulator/tetratricopeptide (TPR) repeat protein